MYFQELTGSTNDDAKAAARAFAAHGALWLADSQAQGRGRQGRSWRSAPGASVLCSLLWRENLQSAHVPLLTLAVGLCVRAVLAERMPGCELLLKWPNDVLARDAAGALRKLSGVLIEAQHRGGRVESLVIGVGINVHHQTLPAHACSAADLGYVLDRAELLAALLARIEQVLPSVLSRGLGKLHAELSRVDALRGRRVQSELGSGVAEGIDERGGLCVRAADGQLHVWCSGEVHLGAAAAAGGER